MKKYEQSLYLLIVEIPRAGINARIPYFPMEKYTEEFYRIFPRVSRTVFFIFLKMNLVIMMRRIFGINNLIVRDNEWK